MRFPMWRQLPDGSNVLVYSYDDVAKHPGSVSLPHKPIPEQPAGAAPVAPPEDVPSEPESAAEQPAEAKRGPGRPRKAI